MLYLYYSLSPPSYVVILALPPLAKENNKVWGGGVVSICEPLVDYAFVHILIYMLSHTFASSVTLFRPK